MFLNIIYSSDGKTSQVKYVTMAPQAIELRRDALGNEMSTPPELQIPA